VGGYARVRKWIERERRAALRRRSAVVSSRVIRRQAWLSDACGRRDLGVAISASHNPFHDNGIKISRVVVKIRRSTVSAIEAIVADASWTVPASAEAHRAGGWDRPVLQHTANCVRAVTACRGCVWRWIANGATTTTAQRFV
jgi:hypothetical protein